jgi:hypothetical protein
LFGIVGFAITTVVAVQVTISNVDPRRDTTGKIMDIHDGTTLHLPDGLYYYYGASYGNCTEFPGNDGCAHTNIGAAR